MNRVNEEWRKKYMEGQKDARTIFFFYHAFARHQNISMRLHITNYVWITNLSKLSRWFELKSQTEMRLLATQCIVFHNLESLSILLSQIRS